MKDSFTLDELKQINSIVLEGREKSLKQNKELMITKGEWKVVYQKQPLSTDHWAIETVDGKNTPCGMILKESDAILIVKSVNALFGSKVIIEIAKDIIKHSQHWELSASLDLDIKRLEKAIAKAEGK